MLHPACIRGCQPLTAHFTEEDAKTLRNQCHTKDLSHTKEELELRTIGVNSLTPPTLQNLTFKRLLGWGRVEVENKRHLFIRQKLRYQAFRECHSEQLTGEPGGEEFQPSPCPAPRSI